MYRHFLVPVDGTDASIEATGQAVEFAQSIGARVTFLPVLFQHAIPSACDAKERAWELLARAEAAARAQGVPYVSIAARDETSFGCITAAARECGCDLICIAPGQQPAKARESGLTPPGGAESGDVAVLICAEDRRPATSRTIGVLLDEHRAIANSLHALLDMVRSARASGDSAEQGSMREAVKRLRDLQVRVHRPKEESWLFPRLRERTSAADAELDELESQHQRDEQLLDELAELVERDPEAGVPVERLEQALGVYAQFTWEHLGREEGVVLPAARRYLQDADWSDIATAFEATAGDSATARTRLV